MFLKNKVLRLSVLTVLTVISLYSGISFAETLLKALNQPYLTAGNMRIDFMGYYLMSALQVFEFIISAVTEIIIISKRKKTKK